MKKYRSDKGFTLIELLAAMSIVLLLASISLAGLSNLKVMAYTAQAKADLSLLKNSIDLFYREQGVWPPSIDNYVFYTSLPGQGWDTFGAALSAYIPRIPYPTFAQGSVDIGGDIYITQGYVYSRGIPTTRVLFTTYDSVTGLFVGCMFMRDGYILDLLMPQQSSATVNDGGIDPDGIEFYDGDFTIYYNQSDCHF